MKPKLACNMSLPLIELLEGERVQLDFLGLTRLDVLNDELDLALRYKPALLHIFESAGHYPDLAERYDWDESGYFVSGK